MQRAERAERHHAAGRVAHVELVEVGGRGARVLVGLQRHAERVAEQIEVVDVERAEIDLQGVEDVGQVEAEQLRLRAVEVVEELRRRGRKRGEQRLRVELGLFARRGDQRLRRVVERGAAGAGEILDLELEAAGRAETVDRRRVEAQREGVGNGEQLWPHLRRPAFEALCSGPRSSHGLRIANSTAEFDCAALVRKLRPLMKPAISTPGVACRMSRTCLRDRVGALERGAVRQLDDDEEIALILDRQEGRRNRARQRRRRRRPAGRTRRPAPSRSGRTA